MQRLGWTLVAVLFLVGGASGQVVTTTEPLSNWQWPEGKASVLHCAQHQAPDYGVEIEIVRKRPHQLTIKLKDDEGREIFSWRGHQSSVFAARDEILYYAEFYTPLPGCVVVAHDLHAGKELWRTGLRGTPPPAFASFYSNLVVLEFGDPGSLIVHGSEGSGRYREVLDLETGETIQHTLYK